MARADIAVIGETGFEKQFTDSSALSVKTPYGIAHAICLKEIEDIRIAFLPRHGRKHSIPLTK